MKLSRLSPRSLKCRVPLLLPGVVPSARSQNDEKAPFLRAGRLAGPSSVPEGERRRVPRGHRPEGLVPDGPRRGAAARFDCKAVSTAVLGGIFVSTFKELRVVLSDQRDYCHPRPCHPAPASLGLVWFPVSWASFHCDAKGGGSPRPPTRPESPQRVRRPAHGTDGFLKLHRIKKK